jgi:hypothetical protein
VTLIDPVLPDAVVSIFERGRFTFEKIPTAVTAVGKVTVKLSSEKKKSAELNGPDTCFAARLFPVKLS